MKGIAFSTAALLLQMSLLWLMINISYILIKPIYSRARRNSDPLEGRGWLNNKAIEPLELGNADFFPQID